MSNPLTRISGVDTNPAIRSKLISNFHRQDVSVRHSQDYESSGVNPMDQLKVDSHVDVPDHLEHRISRNFTFRVDGSMTDLATDPRHMLSVPVDADIFRTHTRYRPDAKMRAPDLRGDLDQVVILGAKVVSYKNGYPVPINVEFVNGDAQEPYSSFRGNYRDVNSGQRVHFSVPSKSSCGNVNQPINITSPFVHSNYLSKYRGLISEASLRTQGINKGITPGVMMVSPEHPLIGVLNANMELLKIDPAQVQYSSVPNGEGSSVPVVYVNEDLANTCLDVLVTDLHQNLPIFNIEGLRMKISRSGHTDMQFADGNGMIFEPEIAQLEHLTNPDGTVKHTQINTSRSFDLVCSITYAFLSDNE